MSRLYVGHLPSRCSEKDIERFFKGYGRLRDVVIKNGYGFVEFYNEKDADDAVHDLHGREMGGERIIVQHARLPFTARGRGGPRNGGGRDRRFGPPTRTEYRIIVENLSSRAGWQDLKDLMRNVGDVTFADAHKSTRNAGIVEFSAFADMKEAIKKFDDYELYGRRLRVYEDRPSRKSTSRSRSRSRSNGGRRRSVRSRSRSYHRRKSHSSQRQRNRSGSSSKRRSTSREAIRRRSVDANGSIHSRSGSDRSRSRHSRERSTSGHSDRRSPVAESRSFDGNNEKVRNGSKGSIQRSRTPSIAAQSDRSRSHSASRSRSRSCSQSARSRSRSHPPSDNENQSRSAMDSD